MADSQTQGSSFSPSDEIGSKGPKLFLFFRSPYIAFFTAGLRISSLLFRQKISPPSQDLCLHRSPSSLPPPLMVVYYKFYFHHLSSAWLWFWCRLKNWMSGISVFRHLMSRSPFTTTPRFDIYLSVAVFVSLFESDFCLFFVKEGGGCRKSLMVEDAEEAWWWRRQDQPWSQWLLCGGGKATHGGWRRQGEAGMAAYFFRVEFFLMIWFSYLNLILF